MVDGLVRLMQSTDDFKGPVNLGNPQEISIFDLASRIVALSGSASKIEFHAATPEDPRRRCPDIGLACSELGWMPKTSLADGLKETIADVERRLHASRTPERLRQSAL
jgi:UDP-glucuronate decarboxylase